ncbi:MAG: hypothetical protein CM1200mP22_13090 [Dehalococcoidia bacterium]|nr:MAG: hypothetical protein CM1200mP22_13090 [Dehalococcoidia bacterium]
MYRSIRLSRRGWLLCWLCAVTRTLSKGGDRLALTTRVVQIEGVSIGMIHDIQWPGPKIPTTPDGSGLILPDDNGREVMARKFKEPVDVVLFGDTHEEIIMDWDGV